MEEEANHRLDALEETLKDLIAGLRRDLKEAGQALRDECQDIQEEVGIPKYAGDLRMPVRPRRGHSMTQLMRSLAKKSTSEPGHRNLPVAAFFVLVGLFWVWVGLVEIKGKVPLALMLVSIGFTNLVTAALYTLPTGRPRALTRAWIAVISLVIVAIGMAIWRLLT